MRYLLFLFVQFLLPLTATAASAAASATDAPAANSATAQMPVAVSAHSLLDASYWKTKILNLVEKFIDNLPHFFAALIILVVGWWLAGRARVLLRRMMVARHVDATLVSFLSQLCYWLMIVIVVMLALQNSEVETTPLSAVLGASALAVGLALQNSLSNFAAGVMIILFRHFRVGDSIEAGGVTGTVEEISIFDTHLITDDNRKIIVPNGKILSSYIVNSSAKPIRRLELTFHLSYESNLKQAKQIILASIQGDIRALPDPSPVIFVSNLGENALHLTMRAWVAIGDYDGLRGHLLEDVKLRFDEAGIVIPRPQREVHLHTGK